MDEEDREKIVNLSSEIEKLKQACDDLPDNDELPLETVPILCRIIEKLEHIVWLQGKDERAKKWAKEVCERMTSSGDYIRDGDYLYKVSEMSEELIEEKVATGRFRREGEQLFPVKD